MFTKKAYKDLFDEMYNPLCNFALRFTYSDSEAEDVVQEVFINLWRKKDEINIKSSIKSYLFQATRNKAIEVIRKKKVHDKYLKEQNTVISFEPDYDKEANNFLLKERLYQSIRQLPPKCQEIFNLSRKEGLTYTEIADHLNLSVKTVENQMSRAIKLLREKLNNYK